MFDWLFQNNDDEQKELDEERLEQLKAELKNNKAVDDYLKSKLELSSMLDILLEQTSDE